MRVCKETKTRSNQRVVEHLRLPISKIVMDYDSEAWQFRNYVKKYNVINEPGEIIFEQF